MVASSDETQKYVVKKRMLGGVGILAFNSCRFVGAARVCGPVSLVAGRDFGLKRSLLPVALLALAPPILPSSLALWPTGFAFFGVLSAVTPGHLVASAGPTPPSHRSAPAAVRGIFQ